MKKILYSTLAIIAAAAVVAAIGRSFNQEKSSMQNHYSMRVDTTQQLITYDITDCPLDLACGQMPDTTDENVVFCAAAAFTGKCLDDFTHSNILGHHISGGVLYEGYTEDKDVASKIRNVDVIVGGHSHTLLHKMQHVADLDGKDVVIVQDWCWGMAIGDLKVKWE